MSRLKELLETGTAVAVVGMAVRFPGARNVREYWANLRGGVESIRDLDPDALERAGVPRSLVDDPAYVRRAAVLEGMDRFDAGFFGFSPKDAAILDPQHRHFLEAAWEALEDAGHVPGRFPGPIGVFAGSGTNAYFWANLMTNAELVRDVGFFLLRHTGNDKDFLSTRVSYEFDLKGPSVNVQTACSTSLVAVHLAMQNLLAGECDMALAGGVTIEQPHGHGYLHKEGEILSPDGHCRAFDAEAAGTVFGSGAGIVVLRRLQDAVADGDTVRAVLLGSAVNNDGSMKVGYLAPSVDGQARAIAEALGVSGVDPATIGFVAAHGTGTEVGDPIEVAALTQAFRTGTERTGYCALGSVKTNIGHTDTAAGVASLVAAVCALEAREIPPTVHYRAPNPRIDFETSPFHVPSELHSWDATGPRRAGVNSLGVGGTNAFVILEEAPEPEASGPGRPVQLLALSGRSRRVLEAAGGDLVDFLESAPSWMGAPALADVAYTQAVGRKAFRHRRAVVAGTAEEAVEALVTGDPDRVFTGEAVEPSPPVSFLFAGGGAQYPGMGAGLRATEPVYREVVEDCLGRLEPTLSTRVRALLLGKAPNGAAAAGEDAELPSVALPALFITQLAQSLLWRSWGIEPASMVGHSMGEYTAACLSGVLSRADALSMVVVRGRLFETLEAGGMLSVSLPEDELRARLPDGLSIAAVNAPELAVASGPIPLLDELEARLQAEEIEHRRVRIAVAAHSSMLEPILGEFEAHLRKMELRPPRIPFASNLSGDWITAEEATDPGYWVRQLRQTVRFSDGVRRLMAEGSPVLLEVGPGRTLATLARLNVEPGAAVEALVSMRHPDDERDDLAFQLGTLGRLWSLGVEVDWDAFHAGQSRRRVPLPTYPFERERHFFEPGNALPLQFGALAGTPPAEPDSTEPMARWFHESTWEEAPPVAPEGGTHAGEGSSGHGELLLFGEVPEALVAGLREAGWSPVVVRAADTFSEGEGGDAFGLRPREVGDWRSLFARLAEQGRPLRGIVHLPLLAPGPEGEGIEAAQARAFDVPFTILRALGEENLEAGFPFVVASTGVQKVEPVDRIEPSKALVLGPVRVAPREIPGLRTRSVDLDPATAQDPGALARILTAELADPGPGAVAAWRNGTRYRERIVTLPLPVSDDAAEAAAGPDPAHDTEGTWLLTGGLGGLGLSIAGELARRGERNLVLLSRRGLPPREAWPHWKAVLPDTDATLRRIRGVEALEAMGCRVETPAVDVTDAAALRAVLDPLLPGLGPLRGVIHAAGVLDDAPILAKELADTHRVLAPKVAGTVALAEVLGGHHPERLVLFSSRSAFSGAPGQVDYTAANAFLDAWARGAESGSGIGAGAGTTVSVEWDVWKETGMAWELTEGLHEAEPSPLSVEALDDPIFRYRLRMPDGEVRLLARLDERAHWMLDEHRLRGGPALIPGSGFIELLRAAHALGTDGAGPAGPLTLHDVLFLQPFLVLEGQSREMAVRVRTARSGLLDMTVMGRSGPGEPWTEHVRGRAEARASAAPDPVRLRKLLRACRDRVRKVDGSPDNPILDFGPRWANLRTIHEGRGEAVLEIELPERFRHDLAAHPLHPALLDVATGTIQTMLAADGNGSGPAGGEVYVPASYASLEMRGPLPPVLLSHVRTRSQEAEGMAVFDISLLDEEGREIVSVEEFVMLRVGSQDLLEAGIQAAASAGGGGGSGPSGTPIPGMEDGLATEDGLRALGRILDAPRVPPVVAVIPRDVHALLAALDEAGAGAPPEPEIDVSEVVEALGAHPAVTDATAVAHPYGDGEVRVVAFVVYDPAQPVTVSELRRFLKARVAEGLVPQNFVEMTAIPRDTAGRVDRSRLSDPFAPREEHVAPRTPTEEIIAEIWSSLLGLARVSVHDNFLDVGGHSLVGIRVLLQIEKRTGVRLHPNALTLQTLEQLAAECDRRSAEEGGAGASPEGPAASEGGFASRILSAVKGSVSRG